MMLRPLKKKIAGEAEEHSRRRLPESLSAVEASLGEVYCHPRRKI